MQLRENVCFFLPFNYIEYSSEWNEKKGSGMNAFVVWRSNVLMLMRVELWSECAHCNNERRHLFIVCFYINEFHMFITHALATHTRTMANSFSIIKAKVNKQYYLTVLWPHFQLKLHSNYTRISLIRHEHLRTVCLFVWTIVVPWSWYNVCFSLRTQQH